MSGFSLSGYKQPQFEDLNRRNSSASPLLCYAPIMIPMDGVLTGKPLDYSFPIFLLQLILIVLTARATAILLRPFKQPRYVAEIISGLLLGPSAMGQIRGFRMLVFPLRSLVALDAVAHLGLIYFIFIVGIEIDSTSVLRVRQSVSFAAACMVVPFAIGAFSGIVVQTHTKAEAAPTAFLTFLSLTLSSTAFSVLTRTLAELKLLRTNIGTTALSAAMLVERCTWVLLTTAISLTQAGGNPKATLYTVISGAAYLVWSFAVVKPLVLWAVQRRTPEGEVVDELCTCVILVGVMVSALMADAIGINAISGAFVYGLVIPHDPLGATLIERVEDFTEGLLLPVFFAICGFKANIFSVKDSGAAAVLVVVVLLAAVAKVACCLLVGYHYEMPFRDGLTIGLLMNTKGVAELVMLNAGRDEGVLSEPSFSILMFMSVAVAALVSPLLTLVAKPTRLLLGYMRRTVQYPDHDSELRVLACVHTTRHVPSMIGLVEAIRTSKRSPLFVLPLHLIELTGRASAMLIVHNDGLPTSAGGPARPYSLSCLRARSDRIIHAFESYEQRAAGVTVQPLTAISPFHTMHEDVCAVAADERAAFIILPFHKQQTVDGGMEVANLALRSVNLSVLAAAPCSVAVLVDRGVGASAAARLAAGQLATHHVAILFLGGPDDREALAIASRMAEHPGIDLTVLRFIPQSAATGSPKAERVLNVDKHDKRERRLDEECIVQFRARHAGNEAVGYLEKVVKDVEELVAGMRSMDRIPDLYVVGRGQEITAAVSQLTAGLTEWSECPELGPIGDMLASTDFGIAASVLVVQQCALGAPNAAAARASARNVPPRMPRKQDRRHGV